LQRIAVDSDQLLIVRKPIQYLKKDYKPDSYKQPSLSQLQEEEEENPELQKSPQEKIQLLWEHMGLYDGSYKKYLLPIQAPSNLKDNESLSKHRQKHKIQPKIINQNLILEPEELSPKTKFSKAARALKFIDNSLLKPIRETPPKLELKLKDRRDTSTDELKYKDNSILKTHRAKLHLPAFTRKFQQRLTCSENEPPKQIQTDRTILENIESSPPPPPETKNRFNYQKQFSQPGSKFKPLNLHLLGDQKTASVSPKIRKSLNKNDFFIPKINIGVSHNQRQNEKSFTERYTYHEKHIQILERANEIDQDSKQKEFELMKNLINLQNNKLQQGLMVARR